ncbi:MAG: GYD domain-containing protein [Candidatus Nezhaarchaeota archaeon]|nr:GYD domain-containing protein [Candidatus Nezhaarchaeota archaeon]MCX8141831.1 GYD domain-containing protein [Candidatus Nezhaarchaeota archaeon]MDW8050388.1 GYD domain-containing protein [Nitrososphaerota archaeon]
MGIYVLLSILTSEGRKTVKRRPERILEVNKEVEAFGAKVLQQYAVLGPYDFVNIVEAPDNETIARISVELGSRGTVRIISMPAIPVEDFIKRIKTQ